MRKLALTAVLASLVAVPVMAQKPMPWNTEIGIRSTFASMDVDGTGLTLIDLPAGNGYQGYGGSSALYAVFPVGGGRLAIEPSFGYSDQNIGGNITTMTAGARVLFSAWRGAYVAAGPVLSLLKSGGEEDARFGGNVAAGYRFPIGGAVTVRGEVFYETMGAGDLLATESSSAFGLALGLGMGIGGTEQKTVTGDRMWDLAIGVQGGYTHVSAPGQIDLSSFSLPGGGSNATLGVGIPITSVSPWFVVIPVGKRMALEPSFSYHSYSVEDGGNGSTYEVGLKANYAFNKVAYAGLSAEMNGLGGDDFDGVDGATGFGIQTGLRFPLLAGLKGRTEINYRTFSAGDNSLLTDYQAFGFTFGVVAPLK